MGTKAKELLHLPKKNLNEAKEELFRPEEDMVSYLVCKNSQFAIENYLKGYLLKNGVDIDDCETIDALYKQCVAINANFEKVDLSDFECKGHNLNSRYCNEAFKSQQLF